ncbi:type II toxin-antitoxin system VapC family toxin [Nitrospirillum sp. BR 11163]|uniref:type II toxin-antitoxin system VapC family toxin n=1 Tax=Nitrospirillum sp. BR 11163 TaxID=3104323 RepID=UPI002AFE309C|nr:type II toxin-antitoxin system VapC family toxin [Nitrospirillum sp. BR 11163]MEA1674802.1 type II toxin-antitoxin system VapC family toxin [Nitrospirillum sp. BR 11163]
MTTFFDTSVLFSALNENEADHEWSKEQLESAERPIVIVDIVYAEFSVGMPSISDVNDALTGLFIERYQGDDRILFLAAKTFLKYKRDNTGPKLGLLPDFLIGAAAAITNSPLVTINSRDFVKYFPTVRLIAPPRMINPPQTGNITSAARPR